MSGCFCVGPQNGEPLCPCAMRGVTIEDGRYVRKEDLGPVKPKRPDDWGKWRKLFQQDWKVTQGCPVCGLGKDGEIMAYACPRADCPSAVRCTA